MPGTVAKPPFDDYGVKGALLGGSTNQRFGLVKDYWLETGSAKIDLGRIAATKKEEDKYVFRCPCCATWRRPRRTFTTAANDAPPGRRPEAR